MEEEEPCLHFLLEPYLVPSPVCYFASRAPLEIVCRGSSILSTGVRLGPTPGLFCLHGTVTVFINLMYINIIMSFAAISILWAVALVSSRNGTCVHQRAPVVKLCLRSCCNSDA